MTNAKQENLTPKGLDGLRPKAKRYKLVDKTGLVVRVEPTGTVTFYTRYQLHKQRRLLKHGTYPDMSLTDARKAHSAALATVEAARKGEEDARDPAIERDTKRAQAALGDTVAAFADVYLELHAKVKKRSWKTDKRILDRDVLPYIGSFKLKDLAGENVQAVIDRIDRRGAPNQAWQTFKVVRKMLNYAVERKALKTSPMAGMKREATYKAKARAVGKEKVEELVGLFKALPELKMQAPVRDLLLFQLYTAVRPSEAREATWDEIDLNTQSWIIPEQRMKMGEAHLVPLTAPTIEILQRMQAFGEKGYVFPGEKEGKPYNLQVLGHALRREENQKILKRHGVKPFQPHDIRRTAATIMRRLGYGLVVDRVLAHAPKSVTDKHYDVHDYEPEKRAALEGLATYLLAIEAKARGENVELVDFRKEKGAA